MRDTSRLSNAVTRGNPRWGFITERMIAHMNIRHGPPQLYTMAGPGDAYRVGATNGHSAVVGSKWGMPMYRFINGTGNGFTSDGIRLDFPDEGSARIWGPLAGATSPDYTFGIVTRVYHPNFLRAKTLLRLLPNPNVDYTIYWLQSYTWRLIPSIFGNLQEVIDINVLQGTVWDRWMALVITGRGSDLRFYAGTCDGEFLGSASGSNVFHNLNPARLELSVIAAKDYAGWDGEIGGFVWTRGVWAESEIRRWIMNPFDWARDYGQMLKPNPSCLQVDADTGLTILADTELGSWTKADAEANLAIDGDTDLCSCIEADGSMDSVLVADASICPEDEL